MYLSSPTVLQSSVVTILSSLELTVSQGGAGERPLFGRSEHFGVFTFPPSLEYFSYMLKKTVTIPVILWLHRVYCWFIFMFFSHDLSEQ